jgi:hypothetical protein
MKGANIGGASDNDCVGCDDGQEGKRKQKGTQEGRNREKRE